MTDSTLDIFCKFAYGPTESALFEVLQTLKLIGRLGNVKSSTGTGSLALLDAGGGYGRDALKVSRQWTRNVIIADKHQPYRDVFEELQSKQDVMVRFVHCDLIDSQACRQLLDNYGPFGMVFSYHLLHYFDKQNLKILFRNFYELLADQGIMLHMFLADEYIKKEYGSSLQHETLEGDVIMVQSHSVPDLQELMASTAFEPISEKDKILIDGLGYLRVVELHPERKGDPPVLHSHILRVLCCKKKISATSEPDNKRDIHE
jgi:hypothetical protein